MLDRAFAHYCITSVLGEGGMGSVYLAEDTVLRRQVAIKFPAAEGDTSELQVRLLREARAASALSHANIAAVYDYGELDGRPYVVMEYVRGRTLGALLEDGPLPPVEAIRITTQVLSALAEAHRQGIVHRDIKPSNIAINERNEVKVLDFGLARRVAPMIDSTEGLTLETASLDVSICGTPAYMAPEQARGTEVDGRADIFSLGVVLYECLTGVRVFQGSTLLDSLTKVLSDHPKPPSEVNPEIPASLDRVVTKALSKDKGDRYHAAEAMLSDISALNSAGAATVLERPAFHLPGRLRSRVRWPVAILALLLAVILGVWFWQAPDPYKPGAEAQRWYQEGVNAMRDGTYHKAAQALQQAVRTDPKFTLAHAALAEAWNELDYSDRARQEMLSALPPGDSPPPMTASEFLQIQATGRLLVQDYQGAIAKYQELMHSLPQAERPAVLLHMGRVYEKADNLDAALESYRAAAREQLQFAAAFLRAGVVHRRKREPANAEEALAKAESLFRSLSNVEGTTEVLYQRSVLANQAGRFKEARSLLDQALVAARSVGSQQQAITALLQLSSVCYAQGLTDESRRNAEEALKLARRHSLDDLTARSLLELGTVAQVSGHASEAEGRFQEALEAAVRFGGRRTEARARFSLASVRVDLGEVDAALKDAEQALRFYEQGGYRREASACSLVVMRARLKKGNYDQVLRQANVQLQAARSSNDQPTVSYLLEMIGAIAGEQERYREAASHYAEGVSISRETGDAVGERWSLAGQADALWRLGRYDQAGALFKEAAGFATAGQDAILLAWIELWQAEMLLSEEKIDQARTRARRAAELAGRNKEILADSTRVMALADLRSGKSAEAVTLSERALEMARSAGLARATLHAQLAHAQALLANGSVEPALEVAREAWTRAEGSQQRESEWRACLLAAAAAGRLTRNGLKTDTESRAETVLAQLRQSLSPQDHADYFGRPDLLQLAATARSNGVRARSRSQGE